MIPTDHLLRRIDVFATAVLADLHEQLKAFYGDIGRPSVDPELMIRKCVRRTAPAAFGQSDMPSRDKFTYTFARVAEMIERFTEDGLSFSGERWNGFSYGRRDRVGRMHENANRDSYAACNPSLSASDISVQPGHT